MIDRLVAADIPTIVEYRNQPEVAEHQGWDVPYRAASAERLVADSVEGPLDDGQLAIRLVEGPLIGDLMAVVAHNTSHAIELGVSLRREMWGQGYAAEAIGAVVDALFTADHVERVQAFVSVLNGPSLRLFERLGFRVEGRLASSYRRADGTLVDEVLFATVRAMWCGGGDGGGWTVEDSPHPADVAFLDSRIDAFNMAATGRADGRGFAVLRRDPHGRIVGGATGYAWAGIGHLDVMWLDEGLRARGLGRELLALAEAEMGRRGASAVYVESYTFQAPGFYERMGYERIGFVDGLPPGHGHVLLRKLLAGP